MTALTVCGRIDNPALEPFAQGALIQLPGLEIDASPITIAALGDATRFHPPGPCRSYIVAGTIQLPSTLVDQLIAGSVVLGVRFSTSDPTLGSIGGLFPPGPPARSAVAADLESPPVAAPATAGLAEAELPRDCLVDVTPVVNN
ncbi:MAG: hypothetical protein ACR2OG_01940 [Gemmatimonadaceae bacterium]